MTTRLNSEAQVNPGGIFQVDSSTQEMDLGTRVESSDGRVFRYVKAGGTALVPGKLQQAPVEITDHQNLVAAAAAVGATSATVTLGSTAATANQYAGGYFIVSITPGQGFQYLIKSHPAADSSATLAVTLEDPIEVALTTSSNVDLVLNPYNGVIVNPTAATSCPVGVAVNDITASQFGWIQTGGVATILADGTITVGVQVVASDATAGAVEVFVSTETQAAVGRAVTGIATTDYGAILLNLE